MIKYIIPVICLSLSACSSPSPGLYCHSSMMGGNYYYAPGEYKLHDGNVAVPANKVMPYGKGIDCKEIAL